MSNCEDFENKLKKLIDEEIEENGEMALSYITFALANLSDEVVQRVNDFIEKTINKDKTVH